MKTVPTLKQKNPCTKKFSIHIPVRNQKISNFLDVSIAKLEICLSKKKKIKESVERYTQKFNMHHIKLDCN